MAIGNAHMLSVGTRKRRGPVNNNKLLPEDRVAHDWYRFVLSFPPHLVRDYLEMFSVRRSQQVLDPFCGTGTTLVECKKLGIPSIGIEAHPMASFAAEVKVSWDVDPDGLTAHSEEIAHAAWRKLEEEGLYEGNDLPLWQQEGRLCACLRSLSPDAAKLLLKGSISPVPLHKVLLILEMVRECGDDRWLAHELLAVAKTAVSVASNLRFGPEVGVTQPKADAPVVAAWLEAVRAIARDVRGLRREAREESVVHRADARRVGEVLRPRSVDAVITSPPYPNEKDYTRTMRLESVLLGFIRDREALCSLKQDLVRSNTRGVFKADSDDVVVAEHVGIQHIAEEIECRRVRLGKTSGFERMYPRVTKLYFGGMVRHLSALRGVLRPGAQLAYVVGDQASYLRVMIRTGEILADLAESLGYDVVRIDLFRTRMATATREQLREEVVVLRWPGRARTRRGS